MSLAIFALLFGLAIAEGLTRILIPQIGWRPLKDDILGWSSAEYQQFEPSNDKPKQDEIRILVLGDSFLAGSGVSGLDERFPKVADKILGDKVEVEIFATGGWGTDQQLLAFLEKGRLWKPSLVIVGFVANNDISNILSNSHGPIGYKAFFKLDDEGNLQLCDFQGNHTKLQFDQNNKDKVWSHSYFFDLFRYHVFGDKEHGKQDFENVPPRYMKFKWWKEKHWEIYRLNPRLSWSPQLGNTLVSAYIHEDFEINSYQWRLFESILRRLHDETLNIGARLIVMLLPVTFKPQDVRFIAGGELEFRFQTPNGEFIFRAGEPRDRLARICNRLEIEFFDPTREFIEIVTKRGIVKDCWPDPKDRHFSQIAHSILGEQLAKYLGNELERIKQ